MNGWWKSATISQASIIGKVAQNLHRPPQKEAAFLPWIGKSYNRMIQILEGSLNCAYFVHGQLLPNSEWVSVHQICQDLNESFSFQVKEQNLVLEFDLFQEPV